MESAIPIHGDLLNEGKCKICGVTRRASWQHELWWQRSQGRTRTNSCFGRKSETSIPFLSFFPFFYVCITHPCSSSPVKLKSVKMSFTIIIIIFKNYHSILVTFTTLCPTFIFSRISSERVLSCIAYTVMCSWIWHGLFPLCSRGHINWWSVSTEYCVHNWFDLQDKFCFYSRNTKACNVSIKGQGFDPSATQCYANIGWVHPPDICILALA